MKVFEKYYLPVAFLGKRAWGEWWKLAAALSDIRKELPEAELRTIGWDLNPQIKMTAGNGQTASIWNSRLVGLTADRNRIIIASWANDHGISNARRAFGRPAERAFRDYDCSVFVSIARIPLDPEKLSCCLVLASGDPATDGEIESVFGAKLAQIVGWPK